MTDQRTDAAERSAHVSRGPEPRATISPVVEVRPGVFVLRAVIEAFEAGAMAMRERAADAADCGCAMRDFVTKAQTKTERWNACPNSVCARETADEIRALPLPTHGERNA